MMIDNISFVNTKQNNSIIRPERVCVWESEKGREFPISDIPAYQFSWISVLSIVLFC